jgi:hypothetical protein
VRFWWGITKGGLSVHVKMRAMAKPRSWRSGMSADSSDSFLDILYLGRIFPRRAAIMAKQELKWSPLLGQYSESPLLARGPTILRLVLTRMQCHCQELYTSIGRTGKMPFERWNRRVTI